MQSATDWVETLSPWPKDGFGTERMIELLDRLDNPQRSFRSVHVVGTKGKSTAARRIAATIGGVAYTSPHVSGWHERLQTDPDGFERAVARVRVDAAAVGATQFETVTAAAFADFEARGIESAAIEAGLGGRHDATNVIAAPVVLLTNVALEHTDVLGETREAIAAEKLAVARSGRHGRAAGSPSSRGSSPGVNCGSATAGSPPRPSSGGPSTRSQRRRCPAGSRSAATRSGMERIRRKRSTGCSSGFRSPVTTSWSQRSCTTRMQTGCSNGWRRLGRPSSRPVPRTTGRWARGRLPPGPEPGFATVKIADDPHDALVLARSLGPRVLVTGSLYLLADLTSDE